MPSHCLFTWLTVVGIMFTASCLKTFHAPSAYRLFSSISSNKSNHYIVSIPYSHWTEDAKIHRQEMLKRLYPPGDDIKVRQHAVKEHPIYNFLHRYYRYTVNDILRYSPGLNVPLEFRGSDEVDLLHHSFFSFNEGKTTILFEKELLRRKLTSDKKNGWIDLMHNWKTLQSTCRRQPFFGCFGYHEWAMLYSGGSASKNGGPGRMKKHQESLPLRISQEVIDEVVESGQMRCTHFDAWRFFHPQAQTFNVLNPLTRQSQTQYEQPGCIHANMDLFRYAYQLYPLVSSNLLRQALDIAIQARKIDMRASPYDCSAYIECQDGPILVETKEGKLQYAQEQERLYQAAIPVRQELLQVYTLVLDFESSPTAVPSPPTNIDHLILQ